VAAHEAHLRPLIPALLSTIRAHHRPRPPCAARPLPGAGAGPKLPPILSGDLSLLFFGIGSLVRLMGSKALAAEVFEAGGAAALVDVLLAVPADKAPAKRVPGASVAPSSVVQVRGRLGWGRVRIAPGLLAAHSSSRWRRPLSGLPMRPAVRPWKAQAPRIWMRRWEGE
jgi:hypothetical protein